MFGSLIDALLLNKVSFQCLFTQVCALLPSTQYLKLRFSLSNDIRVQIHAESLVSSFKGFLEDKVTDYWQSTNGNIYIAKLELGSIRYCWFSYFGIQNNLSAPFMLCSSESVYLRCLLVHSVCLGTDSTLSFTPCNQTLILKSYTQISCRQTRFPLYQLIDIMLLLYCMFSWMEIANIARIAIRIYPLSVLLLIPHLTWIWFSHWNPSPQQYLHHLHCLPLQSLCLCAILLLILLQFTSRLKFWFSNISSKINAGWSSLSASSSTLSVILTIGEN